MCEPSPSTLQSVCVCVCVCVCLCCLRAAQAVCACMQTHTCTATCVLRAQCLPVSLHGLFTRCCLSNRCCPGHQVYTDFWQGRSAWHQADSWKAGLPKHSPLSPRAQHRSGAVMCLNTLQYDRKRNVAPLSVKVTERRHSASCSPYPVAAAAARALVLCLMHWHCCCGQAAAQL